MTEDRGQRCHRRGRLCGRWTSASGHRVAGSGSSVPAPQAGSMARHWCCMSSALLLRVTRHRAVPTWWGCGVWPPCAAAEAPLRITAPRQQTPFGRRRTRVDSRARGQDQGGFHDTDCTRQGLGDRLRRARPELRRRPFSIWDELRATCPIAHTDRRKSSWLPTRYDDVTAIAHDIEHFSSLKVAVIPGDEDDDPNGLRRAQPRVRAATHFGGPAAAHLDPPAPPARGSRTNGSTVTCR